METKRRLTIPAFSLLAVGALALLLGLIQLISVSSDQNSVSTTFSSTSTSNPGVIQEDDIHVEGSVSSVVPMQAPGDSSILFASKQGSETNQIWKMNLDGSNKRKLTDDSNYEHEWSRPSPDGNTILYMRAAKGSSVNFALESNELWLMNADGSNKRSIVSIAKKESYGWKGMGHSEWSPDSKKIVLVATLPNLTSHIFVVDANGNNPDQLTKDTKIDGHNTLTLDPSWSSTNQIVYARSWNCFLICEFQDIFVMDYNSRVERRITYDPHWNFDPYISPDGKTYLWLSFRSSSIMCPCDMIRGNVNGSLDAQAVIADDGTNANGTFSSDSKQILFLRSVGFKQVLYRINIDGSGLTSLDPTEAGQSGIASFVSISNLGSQNSEPRVTVTNPSATSTTKKGSPEGVNDSKSSGEKQSEAGSNQDLSGGNATERPGDTVDAGNQRTAGLGRSAQSANSTNTSAVSNNQAVSFGVALVLVAVGISLVVGGFVLFSRRQKTLKK